MTGGFILLEDQRNLSFPVGITSIQKRSRMFRKATMQSRKQRLRGCLEILVRRGRIRGYESGRSDFFQRSHPIL